MLGCALAADLPNADRGFLCFCMCLNDKMWTGILQSVSNNDDKHVVRGHVHIHVANATHNIESMS